MLKQLKNHDHVLKIEDDFSSKCFYCIVTEFCQYGDLKQLLHEFKMGTKANYLNERLQLTWFLELFDGLSHIHANQIIHRDLTPSNIFLFVKRENRISLKIGDFGLSKQIMNSDPNSYCGTLHYLSPVIFYGQDYSYKTVW